MTKCPAEKARLPEQSRAHLARAEHLHTARKASDIRDLLGLQVEVGMCMGHLSAFLFLSSPIMVNTDVTSYYPPLLLKSLCPCPMVDFRDSSAGKESTCDVGDPSLIPGSGRSAGEGISYPLLYS